MTNILSPRRFELGRLFPLMILMVIAPASCSRRVISVEQVNSIIKDQVPIGSNKQTVRDFIENLKVDSLKIAREADFHTADLLSLGTLDQEKTYALGQRIAEFNGAVIYNSKSDGIFTFDNIVIRFYIDKDGRMIDYTVKEWGSD